MPYKISLIGAGNLGWNLAHAMSRHGQHVQQVISRNRAHAQELALQINASFSDRVEELDPSSDVILLCVKDEVISELASRLNLNRQLLAHCSGSTGMDVLSKSSYRYGVFYPVQTFSKQKLRDSMEVPICVEGSGKEAEDELFTLADSISNKVYRINSSQRLHLHLAAVFANNFSNYLYAIARKIADESHLPFEILKPLIMQTAQNVQDSEPLHVQTGPARRHDQKTIQKQLELLQDKPELKALYELISEMIKNEFPR
jgi:predicted short-subunit dehydrogenase-like oxidoreductase (DUF2520 family)